jgi:hypothetical protein
LKNGPAIQAKGKTFEEAVLSYLPLSKNTVSFTASVNGKLITVIPDAVAEAARIHEIEGVAKLSSSAQFRACCAGGERQTNSLEL